VGATVEVKLIKDGAVVHTLEKPLMISVINANSVIMLNNDTVRKLGYVAIFDLVKENSSRPYYATYFAKTPEEKEKDKSTCLAIPLLLAVASTGDEIKLVDGQRKETAYKNVKIMEMKSTGVKDKPETVDATLRFILHAHAAEKVSAAGGGGV